MALGKYKLALRDYERVAKVRPNDKDAKAKFVECRKIVQQIAFNKAIAIEEKVCKKKAEILKENFLCGFFFMSEKSEKVKISVYKEYFFVCFLVCFGGR